LRCLCLLSAWFFFAKQASAISGAATVKTTKTASAELQLNKSMAILAVDDPDMDQIS
jgi:hypothetical protein